MCPDKLSATHIASRTLSLAMLYEWQAFSDYQMQQMTSHFIDQFGFNDEEFAEQDENVK